MKSNNYEDAITQALKDEEASAKLPTKHTDQVMQRINIAKMLKDLLELEIDLPVAVVRTFNKQSKKRK